MDSITVNTQSGTLVDLALGLGKDLDELLLKGFYDVTNTKFGREAEERFCMTGSELQWTSLLFLVQQPEFELYKTFQKGESCTIGAKSSQSEQLVTLKIKTMASSDSAQAKHQRTAFCFRDNSRVLVFIPRSLDFQILKKSSSSKETRDHWIRFVYDCYFYLKNHSQLSQLSEKVKWLSLLDSSSRFSHHSTSTPHIDPSAFKFHPSVVRNVDGALDELGKVFLLGGHKVKGAQPVSVNSSSNIQSCSVSEDPSILIFARDTLSVELVNFLVHHGIREDLTLWSGEIIKEEVKALDIQMWAIIPPSSNPTLRAQPAGQFDRAPDLKLVLNPGPLIDQYLPTPKSLIQGVKARCDGCLYGIGGVLDSEIRKTQTLYRQPMPWNDQDYLTLMRSSVAACIAFLGSANLPRFEIAYKTSRALAAVIDFTKRTKSVRNVVAVAAAEIGTGDAHAELLPLAIMNMWLRGCIDSATSISLLLDATICRATIGSALVNELGLSAPPRVVPAAAQSQASLGAATTSSNSSSTTVSRPVGSWAPPNLAPAVSDSSQASSSMASGGERLDSGNGRKATPLRSIAQPANRRFFRGRPHTDDSDEDDDSDLSASVSRPQAPRVAPSAFLVPASGPSRRYEPPRLMLSTPQPSTSPAVGAVSPGRVRHVAFGGTPAPTFDVTSTYPPANMSGGLTPAPPKVAASAFPGSQLPMHHHYHGKTAFSTATSTTPAVPAQSQSPQPTASLATSGKDDDMDVDEQDGSGYAPDENDFVFDDDDRRPYGY